MIRIVSHRVKMRDMWSLSNRHTGIDHCRTPRRLVLSTVNIWNVLRICNRGSCCIALANLRAAISWQSLQDGAGGTVYPPPLAELRLSACIAQQLEALVITRYISSVSRRSVAVVAFSERPTCCSH